jgi:hypothetical protein
MGFKSQRALEPKSHALADRRFPPNDARIAPDKVARALQQESPLAAPTPGFTETSEFFVGSVVVGIITPESTGAIDRSTENWSSDRQNTVVSKIMQGLQWWKDNANAPANLSFIYDIHHSVPTPYEPISRSSADEDLWISQVMANLGYGGSPSSYFTQVRQYLNDKRIAFGTNWAVAVFVVDSLNDSNGAFANGDFAYTYVNGPFTVMTYDNDGWGIDEMQIVMAHENGHLWGGLDEYSQSGCTDTERSGYLNIANSNCENGTPPSEDSIMRGSNDQANIAFPNHLVSTPIRQMVGWRDSDGDGKDLYDPVDTTPAISLSPFSPNPTTNSSPVYNGSVQDIPFPSPAMNSITINKIVTVQWRIDGGPWQTAAPGDGVFNSYLENFTFTAAGLSAGTHRVEAHAINSVGNSSAIASDTLTILPTSTVSIGDVSLAEGNGGTTNANFTVSLSAPAGQQVTVTYNTVNGTALAGQDYAAGSGTVVFNPGETTKTITVMILGDSVPESNEIVYVNLTTATNATILRGQGIGTILNDDGLCGLAEDFDGDCKADIGIYRDGAWSIIGSSDGAIIHVGWGGSSWIPVSGDFDGDGRADVAVYNPIGVWSIVRSSDGGGSVIGWGGGPTDIPVAEDYDGDGKTDIAIYRDGAWSIIRSSDGAVINIGWGGPSWMPVPADYDGDGRADIAVYNPTGVWSIIRSSDGANIIVEWGGSVWQPVPADYDGDGKADVAVYSSSGAWSILRSSDGGNTLMDWGGGTWIPVPADYDGDGKADIAVYNPAGVWSIVRSSDGGNTVMGWGGAAQDVPLSEK